MKIYFFILVFFITDLYSKNYDDLYVKAGNYYNVSSRLLKAIAQIESGENVNALHVNENGTYDVGIMQINSVHFKKLAKYGITTEEIKKADYNIFIGAFILKQCINKHGINENAINCYNGRISNNPYSKKVITKYNQISYSYNKLQ